MTHAEKVRTPCSPPGCRAWTPCWAAASPKGICVLVAGPSGTGNSILATQFIAEGLRQGEPGVITVFEEGPAEYAARATSSKPASESIMRRFALTLAAASRSS
jgi:KaiC/GvpD/RAD55 family RecA-like ATPase